MSNLVRAVIYLCFLQFSLSMAVGYLAWSRSRPPPGPQPADPVETWLEKGAHAESPSSTDHHVPRWDSPE